MKTFALGVCFLQATYEGVAALQQRVQHTSRAAMGIVASIVGAPSTQVGQISSEV